MAKKMLFTVLMAAAFLNITCTLYATELETQLYESAKPYIKYYANPPLPATRTPASGDTRNFSGLTLSWRFNPDPHVTTPPVGEPAYSIWRGGELENHGSSVYDMAVLGRIELANGLTTIIDRYVIYATPTALADLNNPLIYCDTKYRDGSGQLLKYGGYWFPRISGRNEHTPSFSYNWWDHWDWRTDTGGTACFITYAAEAYQKIGTASYKNLAILFGEYILKLQDTDGGIRYMPRIYDPDTSTYDDSKWNLKSTEQNERCEYALRALAAIDSADPRWLTAADNVRAWIKSMYDFSRHVYHTGAAFDGLTWNKDQIVSSDVIGLAPIDVMLTDTYFGATQAARDAEVYDMFEAAETDVVHSGYNSVVILNAGKPAFCKYSNRQAPLDGWGSVEFSAQFAMGYLKAAQTHHSLGNSAKTQHYLDRYFALTNSLSRFYSVPGTDPQALVAPNAQYYLEGGHADYSVAAGLWTPYWSTNNSPGYTSSAYIAFAKSGYDPYALGGGPGIPQLAYTLNISEVPWYQNVADYNSTAAASSQMVLNYLRQGATGFPDLSQNEIYLYARPSGPFNTILKADEVNNVMNHFQPGGYHFSVRSFDSTAFTNYMREICHWMGYDVPGVTRQNVPVVLPILGSYSNWVTVKGLATDTDPHPTTPWAIPEFTVYGLWLKDPKDNGIGKDTYKTAYECQNTYFLPLASSGDSYNGKYAMVAEPPPAAKQQWLERQPKFKAKIAGLKSNHKTLAAVSMLNSRASAPVKQNLLDMVDIGFRADPAANKTLSSSRIAAGGPIRVYLENKRGVCYSYYWLLPCSPISSRDPLSVSAILIVNKEGAFTEGTCIDMAKSKAARFPYLSELEAEKLIKDYLRRFYDEKIAKLNRSGRLYAYQKAALIRECAAHIAGVNRAKGKPCWGDPDLSNSKIKWYWKFGNSYVTQDKRVVIK